MRAAVITFPGSNCDKDVAYVLENDLGTKVDMIFHKDTLNAKYDLVILPGGFSYGDYLRCGAMAKFSPVMNSIISYRKKGGKVLGICNGFQILTESELLPGALIRNRSLHYICEDVVLKPKSNWHPLTQIQEGRGTVRFPIAHGEGCFYGTEEVLKELEGEGRILYQYENNPNGSLKDIAGICSEDGKVVGLMPHPERAMNSFTGNRDGLKFFETMLNL
jgi:phosphoribosylformylglycinamidine synthase I